MTCDQRKFNEDVNKARKILIRCLSINNIKGHVAFGAMMDIIASQLPDLGDIHWVVQFLEDLKQEFITNHETAPTL